MKILSRVFCFSIFSFVFMSLSVGQALAAGGKDEKDEKPLSMEAAERLIDELETAGDATEGLVPVETGAEFYDIYARRIAYRENAKAFRQSLEDRRYDFQSHYLDKQKHFETVLEKVYKAEIANYQKELAKKEKLSKKDIGDVVAQASSVQRDDERRTVDKPKIAENEAEVDAEDNTGLKEADIPVEENQKGKIKKKVVTSEDAPDFDPADLSDGEGDEVLDEGVEEPVKSDGESDESHSADRGDASLFSTQGEDHMKPAVIGHSKDADDNEGMDEAVTSEDVDAENGESKDDGEDQKDADTPVSDDGEISDDQTDDNVSEGHDSDENVVQE